MKTPRLRSALRSRYLPLEPSDQVWGIFLRDVGRAAIAPGGEYPPSGHPREYAFEWETGRVLDEFQILFISRGKGILETKRAGRRTVRGGQAFVLFPGEWHRYKPVANAGWTETWVGFAGDYAAHLMNHFFSVQEPLLALGEPNRVPRILETLLDEKAGWGTANARRSNERIRLLELIAQLSEHRRSSRAAGETSALERARMGILAQATERIDWRMMARKSGLGYATFRRHFKVMTGRSPLDFQIQVRLNRAVEMLEHSPLTAREIAERLGYAHVHFFSRQFKKRFGVSPQGFRARGAVVQA